MRIPARELVGILEEFVLPLLLTSLVEEGLMTTHGSSAPGGFMDALPDPMKVDPVALGFVIALLAVLFLFMKFIFFKPIIQVMDEREAAIQSGADSRADAAALVERRQADYAARLRDLRAQAFEHRKTLAAAATREKQAILEEARATAGASRTSALAELQAAKESAKTDLLTQVDALSESMVQHLLKQA